MYRVRGRQADYTRIRVIAIIRSDRAAMKLQQEIEAKEIERAKIKENNKWTLSIYRKVKVGCKEMLNNWLWDKM